MYPHCSGSYPFHDDVLFEQIESVSFSFASDVWRSISSEAKAFISSLIVKDPDSRMNARQCLEHVWITGVVVVDSTPTRSKLPMLPPSSSATKKRMIQRRIENYIPSAASRVTTRSQSKSTSHVEDLHHRKQSGSPASKRAKR